MALEKDRENLFFIDVQARGAHPGGPRGCSREKGSLIAKQPGDDEILETPSISVPLATTSSALRLGGDERQQTPNAANIVSRRWKNPHIPASEWARASTRWACASPHEHDVRPLLRNRRLPGGNGLGARDEIDANGDINDDYRISYLREHIRAMRGCYRRRHSADGLVPAGAASIWSLGVHRR
ncbi:family 1 glycosylhydrolase [Klebsiella pneumoniae subsp. pneumoniae]|nr:family 1 glycosylhydrolase [Klebsiella pneumoniae subsp. pneumoniae]